MNAPLPTTSFSSNHRNKVSFPLSDRSISVKGTDMDMRENHSTASSVVICGLYLITKHLLQGCLLVLLGGLQTVTNKAGPNFNFYVPLDEMNSRAFLRFCDTDYPIYDNDSFCNRIVAIVAHGNNLTMGTGQIVVPGIFIDNKRILTSYTPFRILRKTRARKQIYINYLVAKGWDKNKTVMEGYFWDRIDLKCARQIVPMSPDLIEDEQWHGPNHTHTPLHDLMVMKVNGTMKFGKEGTWHSKFNKSQKELGPKETERAQATDEFPAKYKIVSLGLMDDDHVYNKNHLHTSMEYDSDDKAAEDCEEWIPRDWGHFICIKNEEDFVGIGSGALLVGSDKSLENGAGKVYGIGSFMLRKEKASILVFTDIRPYLNAMDMTCNSYDGN